MTHFDSFRAATHQREEGVEKESRIALDKFRLHFLQPIRSKLPGKIKKYIWRIQEEEEEEEEEGKLILEDKPTKSTSSKTYRLVDVSEVRVENSDEAFIDKGPATEVEKKLYYCI
jgi:hypothetical protein